MKRADMYSLFLDQASQHLALLAHELHRQAAGLEPNGPELPTVLTHVREIQKMLSMIALLLQVDQEKNLSLLEDVTPEVHEAMRASCSKLN